MRQEFTLEKVRRVKTGSKMQLCFEFPDPETAENFWMRAFKYEKDTGDGTAQRGSEFRVTVRKPKQRRSTGRKSQNTHINGHVQEICETLGTDFEDTKVYLKRVALAQGYPFMRDRAGDIVYSMMDKEPLPEHESEVSSEDAAVLIDAIHQFAAEHLIELTEE